MKNIKQYYKELGKAVYAVAMADGVVSESERETLHQFVLKDLVNHEATLDSSGMNQAFYVDFEFEGHTGEKPDIEAEVRSYIRFVHNNFEPGDEGLLNHSVSLLEKVAGAYSRSREIELVAGIRSEVSEVYKEFKI
jgi:hypothetical protein